jgi:hypothetical protein
MNDPNDQVPLDRPTIPRFGGLNDLPDLPPIPTPEPRIQPTPATPIPAPPKVMIDLPKPSPSIRIDPPKPAPTPAISTNPVAKVPAPAAVSDTPPEPRWVKEALMGFVKPTKKAAALGTAICLIGGAFGFQYFFTGKIPSREVAGTSTTAMKREVIEPGPGFFQLAALEFSQNTPKVPEVPVPIVPVPGVFTQISDSLPGPGFFTLATLDSYVELRRNGMAANVNPTKPNFAVPSFNTPTAPSGLNMPVIPAPGNFPPIVDTNIMRANNQVPVPTLPPTPAPAIPAPSIPMPMVPAPMVPETAQPMIPAPITPAATTPTPVITPVVPVVKPAEPIPVVNVPKTIEITNFDPKTVPMTPAMPANIIPTPIPMNPAPTTVTGDAFKEMKTPEAPVVKPVTPAEPAPFTMTKPPGAVTPTPVPTPVVTPTNVRSDFDVDIHVVKPGESYDAISEKHYGSAKFALALREFNRNRELVNGNEVELPPLVEMRKRVGSNAVRPVNPTSPGTPWNTAPGRPAPATRTYRIPKDGMTMWDIAEAVYGNQKEMTKIRLANSTLDVNAKFRAGDTVNLPADAPTVR